MPVLRRDEVKPPPKPELPPIAKVIEPIDGDPNLEFYKYIHGKLVYPREAVENHVSGKVTVKFVVNHKGYIERAEILKGVHPSLDEEALRVINSSPRWEPGFQSGHYVNVIYTFPINFVLH